MGGSGTEGAQAGPLIFLTVTGGRSISASSAVGEWERVFAQSSSSQVVFHSVFISVSLPMQDHSNMQVHLAVGL